MTKSILAAAVGVFLLAGTALAGTTQTKATKGGGGAATGTTATKSSHHKSHKKHHSSKKSDMSQKAS